MAMAWAKSAIMSSMSSKPTDTRIMDGFTPAATLDLEFKVCAEGGLLRHRFHSDDADNSNYSI
jgi:hypothetical protein